MFSNFTAFTDKETGEMFIVVSGGFSGWYGSNIYLDSTEILIDGQWIQGKYQNQSLFELKGKNQSL